MTPFVSEQNYPDDDVFDATIAVYGKPMTADRYLRIWKERGGETEDFWQS
jgi:hypothetical protein